MPVAGWHAVTRHSVSPLWSHVTTEPGATSHWPPSPQRSVPLHASSSSWGAHSLSVTQAHASVAVPAQAPPAQTSSAVQPLPSSHGVVFGAKTHSPGPESQASSVQGFPSSQSLA